jgi:integrase
LTEIHRLGVGVGGRLMVSVYLRQHVSGDCFYARYKVSNPKSGAFQRYITESLQTDDFNHAVEKARTRYAEITLMETQGKAIKSSSVASEIDRFMQNYEQGLSKKLGSYTASMYRTFRKTIVRYWKEYIGKLELKNVTWDHLNDYEAWRQNYYEERKSRGIEIHGNSKNFASSKTIEGDINSFKFFLRWCSVKGYYAGNALEYIVKNKGTINKRSAFTTTQWTKLTGFMRRNGWYVVGRRGNDSRLIRYRHMLKAYVLFMKNTGLRVGESRKLRWEDVEFVADQDPSKQFLRVKVLKENSKTRKNAIVIGNEGAFNALFDWFQYRKSHEDFVNSKDPIWCDVEGRVINEFREGFNSLIKDAGVALDASGNKLTIYSLRHTYITEQLKGSVPIYTIASNCNTSVSMIERYYSDARPKDFEDSLTEGYRKTSRLAVTNEKVVHKNNKSKTKNQISTKKTQTKNTKKVIKKSDANAKKSSPASKLPKVPTKPIKSATKTTKTRTGTTGKSSTVVRKVI